MTKMYFLEFCACSWVEAIGRYTVTERKSSLDAEPSIMGEQKRQKLMFVQGIKMVLDKDKPGIPVAKRSI